MANITMMNINGDVYTPTTTIKNLNIDGLTYIIGGGIDTSDATATADDIIINKTAYVNNIKVTGTLSNIVAFHANIDDWGYSNMVYYPCRYRYATIDNKFFEYYKISNPVDSQADKQLLCRKSGTYKFFIINYASYYAIGMKFKVVVNGVTKMEGTSYNDLWRPEKIFFSLSLNENDKVEFFSADDSTTYGSGRSVLIYYVA